MKIKTIHSGHINDKRLQNLEKESVLYNKVSESFNKYTTEMTNQGLTMQEARNKLFTHLIDEFGMWIKKGDCINTAISWYKKNIKKGGGKDDNSS